MYKYSQRFIAMTQKSRLQSVSRIAIATGLVSVAMVIGLAGAGAAPAPGLAELGTGGLVGGAVGLAVAGGHVALVGITGRARAALARVGVREAGRLRIDRLVKAADAFEARQLLQPGGAPIWDIRNGAGYDLAELSAAEFEAFSQAVAMTYKPLLTVTETVREVQMIRSVAGKTHCDDGWAVRIYDRSAGSAGFKVQEYYFRNGAQVSRTQVGPAERPQPLQVPEAAPAPAHVAMPELVQQARSQLSRSARMQAERAAKPQPKASAKAQLRNSARSVTATAEPSPYRGSTANRFPWIVDDIRETFAA